MTNYAWGAFSLLAKVTNSNTLDTKGYVVGASYDSLGRPSGSSDPDRGNRTFTYDAFGDLTSIVDPKGTTNFTSDSIGRITKIVSPDGTTTYTWDTATNGIGELDSSTSPNGVDKTMTYDTLSRLDSETWRIDGEGYAFGLSYDKDLGRLSTVTYPAVPGFSTFKTQYNYAANGDLLSLTDVPSGTAAAKVFWTVDEQDAAGRIRVEETGDTGQTTYAVDELRGVVTGITTTIGQSILQSLGYDYDPNLNVKTRGDSIAGISEKFEYDALDRLQTWSEVGSYGWAVTYGHDDVGNLTGRSLSGANGESESLTFEHSGVKAGPHAVTGSPWGSYGYDSKGNMTSSPEGTIEYTAFNLPKKIDGADATTFEYDADGERARKHSTVAASTTVYAGGLYERRTVAGAKTHVFYLSAAGRQIGQVVRNEADQSESILFVHTDALGSAEAITDKVGNMVEQRRKYDPFGSPTDMTLPKLFPGASLMSSNVHLGFTGQELDLETGLINMKGRIYNPHVGHFLTPDPVVNDPFTPVGFNPYAYVLNNPLKFTDPTGFQESYTIGGLTLVRETYGYPDDAEGGEGYGEGGGGGSSCGGDNPWDPSTWRFPNNPSIPYPIQRLHDSRGTLVMRLPGGGWMRDDSPGTVFFQTRDGRSGAMSLGNWLSNYMYDLSSPPNSIQNQRVIGNLGNVSDNPTIDVVANRATPLPLGGQSAPTSHLNQGPRTLDINGFGLGVQFRCSTCVGIEQIGKLLTPQSPAQFAAMAIGGPLLDGALGAVGSKLLGKAATRGLTSIPGRVLSRLNISNSGWAHVLERHFAGTGSRFSIAQGELRALLQSRQIVGSPITRTLESADGLRYLREVDIGRTIGFDKFAGAESSILSVISDEFGNLVSAFPGVLK